MLHEWLDRARTALEPFRFGFPRLLFGIAVYTRAVHSDDPIFANLDSTVKGMARELFTGNSRTLYGYGTCIASLADYEDANYSIFMYGGDDAEEHFSFLDSAASYAGKALLDEPPPPRVFLCFPDAQDVPPDSQMQSKMRWYVRLLSEDRFVRQVATDFDEVESLRICDDVFGATWKLLNELLLPRSLPIPPEPQDDEEREIIELLRTVGHRLTTSKLLSEFDNRGSVKAESTIKLKLSRMVTAGLLSNRQDIKPHKGYGLPEWGS